MMIPDKIVIRVAKLLKTLTWITGNFDTAKIDNKEVPAVDKTPKNKMDNK